MCVNNYYKSICEKCPETSIRTHYYGGICSQWHYIFNSENYTQSDKSYILFYCYNFRMISNYKEQELFFEYFLNQIPYDFNDENLLYYPDYFKNLLLNSNINSRCYKVYVEYLYDLLRSYTKKDISSGFCIENFKSKYDTSYGCDFFHVYKDLAYQALSNFLYDLFGVPYSDDNELFSRERFKRINSLTIQSKIKRKYREGKVNVRTGQKIFKKDLLKFYGKCQLCDIENSSLLIASHIKPYLDSELDECIDFNNGLLLCPNHDKLFDKKLISFNDDGTILISDKLSRDDVGKLDILNKKIRVFQEQKKYLKWHREHLI